MIEIETLGGDTIDHIAWKALQKAYKSNEPVVFKFNGVQFIAYRFADH